MENQAPQNPPIVQQQIPSPVTVQSSVGINTPPPPKKNNSKFVIILIAVLAALGVIIAGIFLLGKGVPGSETTITWWGLWEDQSIVAPIIAEYENENPKIKINYVKQSHQDYRERLTNSFAKGTGPISLDSTTLGCLCLGENWILCLLPLCRLRNLQQIIIRSQHPI